jgi:hypothetical protein
MSTQTTPPPSTPVATPSRGRPTAAAADAAPGGRLLDRKAVEAEYGLKRSTVDCIFCRLPVVVFPEHRKVYVWRTDLDDLLTQATFANDGTAVRPS